MKLHLKSLAALSIAGASLLFALPASTREPFTKEELADQQVKLLKVVDTGFGLWHGGKAEMSNNGLACANCHPDGTASNPQTFPKFMPMFDKVVGFREMVNWCIENPQGGQALPVSSDEMTAMEAYAHYLYRGRVIEPGLATRQTKSIPVTGGFGYGKKPTGLGADK